VVIMEASVHEKDGKLATDFEYGEQLRIKLRCLARSDVHNVQCSITVRGDYVPLFTATSQTFAEWNSGPHDLECVFEALPLLPNLYRVEVQIRHADTPRWALPRTLAAFRVITELTAFGSDSPVGATKSRGGFLAVAYDWRVQSLAGDQVLPGLRMPRKM